MKKQNILTGPLAVYTEPDKEDIDDIKQILLGSIEVEFLENYFRLTLRFPDGSFRTLWISQKARMNKLEKAR